MILATASDAAALFKPCFADAEGETIAVAHLDAGRRLIELVVIGPAARDHIDLPVRRVIEDSLRLGARGLILAHNHPAGDPEPSRDDVEATRELAETAARLGIKVHDHLIFAGDASLSLRALGLL